MAFFSRCDAPQPVVPALRGAGRRRPGSGLLVALSDFAEELGILFRYAAGLDYYGRDGAAPGR